MGNPVRGRKAAPPPSGMRPLFGAVGRAASAKLTEDLKPFSAPELEVERKLEALLERKARLDAVDVHISKRVPDLEEVLDGLRLGVPLNIKIESTDDGWETWLSFEKFNGRWRLLISQGLNDGDPTTWKEMPLADASREIRATVFDAFVPRLLDLALVQMDEKLEARERAVQSSDVLISRMASFNLRRGTSTGEAKK
jgi:hypothetical protein